MENLGSTSDMQNRYRTISINLLPAPLSALLELSGLVRGRSRHSGLDTSSVAIVQNDGLTGTGAEVAIRIIGDHDQGTDRVPENDSNVQSSGNFIQSIHVPSVEHGSRPFSPRSSEIDDNAESSQNNRTDNRATTAQRYDFQPIGRWLEQVLPFTILLLLVFIRQHLQGLFITFWVTAVMIKANDFIKKQTALKGERKRIIIIAIGSILMCHIAGVYWWYSAAAIWRPLLWLPPNKIPKFWEAIFMIVLNDTMARQAAMVAKCGLLLSYKNFRGRNFRRQAQLLTFVEYISLLYRAIIPGPVWYRFFLNKEYGNFFSSLTTGLYLTFKLTSVFEKVQMFIASLRVLSCREVQYGAYATSEEVLAAGDLCAICQEKMHAPILLRCKHLFCEDCVSEWFERERTCPLCRAIVKSTDLRSYGDGSTSLCIQVF